MTTPHQAKRRRINDTLTKPFRSPLRTASTPRPVPLKTPSRLWHTDNSSPSVTLASAPVCSSDAVSSQRSSARPTLAQRKDEIPDSEDDTSPLTGAFPAHIAGDSTEGQLSTPAPSMLPHSTAATAPEEGTGRNEADKRVQIRELEEQISILSGSKAGKTSRLPELISRWTQAARDAAEVLYPDIKARVETSGSPRRLGGTGGEGRAGDGQGGGGGGEDRVEEMLEELDRQEKALERGIDVDGTKLGGAEKQLRVEEIAAARKRLRAVAGGGGQSAEGAAGDGGGGKGEDEEEDHGFTMGTMLRSMHIEWDLIGWNEEAQDWVEPRP